MLFSSTMVKLQSPGWYLTWELWLRKATGFWQWSPGGQPLLWRWNDETSLCPNEGGRTDIASARVGGNAEQSSAAARHVQASRLLSADAVFGTFWARPMNFNPTGTKSMSCHNHLLQPEHAGCDWETLTIANIFFWADSIQTYLLVGKEFRQSFYKGFNVWKIKIKLDLLFLYLKRQIINHN